METTVEKALEELKAAKELKPVYLLTGEDNYMIDVLSNFFENNADDDIEKKVIYGRDTTMQDIITLAFQTSMFASKKILIIKEAQDLPTKDNAWEQMMAANTSSEKKSTTKPEKKDDKKDDKKESNNSSWERLAHYLNDPAEQTTIVLCYRYKKLDKRSAAYKAIDKVGTVYEQKKLYESQIAQWIATYVRQKGYSITEKCAMLIASTINNDRAKLINELDKVMTMLPKGGVINDAAVEKYMGISKDYNIFELQDAIGSRNVAKCSLIVNYLSCNPKAEPIQKIIPMLYKYIVDLMVFIQDPSQSKSSYAARRFEVASSKYTLSKLALCIGYLHDADLRSKGVLNTGTISDSEILKELIFKITHT